MLISSGFLSMPGFREAAGPALYDARTMPHGGRRRASRFKAYSAHAASPVPSLPDFVATFIAIFTTPASGFFF